MPPPLSKELNPPADQVSAVVRTWESDEYHSFWNRPDLAYLDRMERKLLPMFMDSGRWFIDIGGGFGRLVDLYQKRFAHAVISDYSLSMLEDAERHLRRRGLTNVSLVAADAHRLPFVDNAFAGAMMVRLVHHIADPASVIREAHRILNPKAHFIFEFQNKRNFHFRIKARFGFMKGKDLVGPEPIELQPLYWNYHPQTIMTLLSGLFDVRQTVGGGIFWHQKLLTSVIPNLEACDLMLARFLGRHALTHQIFLSLETRKNLPTTRSLNGLQDLSLLSILKCLRCGHDHLNEGESRLVCRQCGQSYPVKGLIHDFRLTDN